MELSCRDFLNRSALAGTRVLLIGSTDMLLTAPGAFDAPTGLGAAAEAGYGPLVHDPAGRLALPAGFQYTIVTQGGAEGTRLESGEPTPGAHDGTGAFWRPGGTVLVNNHEIGDPLASVEFPVPHLDGLVYDPGMAGGCTVVHTRRDGSRVREYVGLAGTSQNCAGGVTPWGTWLTCEETETRAGEDGATKDHGYVFEVDPYDRSANRDPQPIRALGRFEHKAVAVDPRTGDIYLTEDARGPNGLLYRWVAPLDLPRGRRRLRGLSATAGTLGAMKASTAAGVHVDDLSRATKVGTVYAITWIPVPDRDATTTIREQFADTDITRARKLEGAWWGDGGAYIVTSFARNESSVPHGGQVWFYNPRHSTLTLRLRFGINPNPTVDGAFDGPDNITVSPYGGLILAEDGEGIQHLVGVTGDGRTFPLARNDIDDDEFTGPTYSLDRRILFANLQTPGTMFAITGPWRRQPSR
ncbi:MAG TPA: alkaline phosphatase PhoX [Pseudonocardiaceae bacterium]|nr:alkaline phosphatase PhoX [Pseudonocardiaceae bacterium]